MKPMKKQLAVDERWDYDSALLKLELFPRGEEFDKLHSLIELGTIIYNKFISYPNEGGDFTDGLSYIHADILQSYEETATNITQAKKLLDFVTHYYIPHFSNQIKAGIIDSFPLKHEFGEGFDFIFRTNLNRFKIPTPEPLIRIPNVGEFLFDILSGGMNKLELVQNNWFLSSINIHIVGGNVIAYMEIYRKKGIIQLSEFNKRKRSRKKLIFKPALQRIQNGD